MVNSNLLMGYYYLILIEKEIIIMSRIITIVNTKNNDELRQTIGCGECQASCQSACKTSCTVGNQHCENKNRDSQI